MSVAAFRKPSFTVRGSWATASVSISPSHHAIDSFPTRAAHHGSSNKLCQIEGQEEGQERLKTPNDLEASQALGSCTTNLLLHNKARKVKQGHRKHEEAKYLSREVLTVASAMSSPDCLNALLSGCMLRYRRGASSEDSAAAKKFKTALRAEPGAPFPASLPLRLRIFGHNNRTSTARRPASKHPHRQQSQGQSTHAVT